MVAEYVCEPCLVMGTDPVCWVCGDDCTPSCLWSDPTVSSYRNAVLRSYSGFAQYDADDAA